MPDPVREALVARPRGPLRAVVAEHHAFRFRHVPPARHLGLPSPYLTVIVTLDEPLHVTRHPDAAQAPAERGWQCPEPRPPRLRLYWSHRRRDHECHDERSPARSPLHGR